VTEASDVVDVRFIGPVSGRYNLLSEGAAPGPVYACRTQSLSPYLVVIAGPVSGNVGQQVTLLLDHVGFLKATIRHVVPHGFQAEIASSRADRVKLATRIGWLKRHHLRQTVDKRSSTRKLPRRGAAQFYLGDQPQDCFVVDYSTKGAGISASNRPPLGTALVLGDIPAQIIRHMDVGFAVRFAAELPLDTVEARLAVRREVEAQAAE
jgi:hypothetical protein